MRRAPIVLLAVAGLIAPISSEAASDAAVLAQGTAALRYGSPAVSCTAPLVVTLHVRANQAIVTESWGPGSPGVEACTLGAPQFQYEADTTPYPAVTQCLPVGALRLAPYLLSQSGSTYTIQSTSTGCGHSYVDRIVLTVGTSLLAYSHTYSDNGTTLVSVSAGLPRVA